MARKPAFRPVTARDFDFAAAPIYRKSAWLRADQIEVAKARQPVITRIGGIEETRNIARKGDRIVTGPRGERWVIKAGDFAKLYKRDTGRPDRLLSKSRVHAIKLKEGVELVAPWGEKQRARAGGYVVQRVGSRRDVYLIEEIAFKRTYRRERPVTPAKAAPKPASKPRAKK